MADRSYIKDDFQLPTLNVAADQETQFLEAKIGKVVWALTELEVALGEGAAQKVHTLKHEIADKLSAIIREVGNYRTL